jgi:hypothetical protein
MVSVSQNRAAVFAIGAISSDKIQFTVCPEQRDSPVQAGELQLAQPI